MKIKKYENFAMGSLLLISSWSNYLTGDDYCLYTGGKLMVCGNFAIIVMLHATVGGVYLIYSSLSFKSSEK